MPPLELPCNQLAPFRTFCVFIYESNTLSWLSSLLIWRLPIKSTWRLVLLRLLSKSSFCLRIATGYWLSNRPRLCSITGSSLSQNFTRDSCSIMLKRANCDLFTGFSLMTSRPLLSLPPFKRYFEYGCFGMYREGWLDLNWELDPTFSPPSAPIMVLGSEFACSSGLKTATT